MLVSNQEQMKSETNCIVAQTPKASAFSSISNLFISSSILSWFSFILSQIDNIYSLSTTSSTSKFSNSISGLLEYWSLNSSYLFTIYSRLSFRNLSNIEDKFSNGDSFIYVEKSMWDFFEFLKENYDG